MTFKSYKTWTSLHMRNGRSWRLLFLSDIGKQYMSHITSQYPIVRGPIECFIICGRSMLQNNSCTQYYKFLSKPILNLMTLSMKSKGNPHISKGKQFCVRLADMSVWEGERGKGRSGIDPLKMYNFGIPLLPPNPILDTRLSVRPSLSVTLMLPHPWFLKQV